MKPRLDFDLYKADWIAEKCKQDDTYAQNLYASMCQNIFYHFFSNTPWQTSWRGAGSIVADLRDCGEDYIDWYCSGMINKKGNVPEGVVTDEVRVDLMRLGWKDSPHYTAEKL